EDILHEISQQLEPLQQQADTAQKYQTYQTQLKETEVSLLVTQIEQLHAAWQEALKEVEKDEQVVLEKRTIIQQKEAHLTKDREQIQQLDKHVTQQQQALLNITEQLKQQEGKRNVL